MELGHLLLQGVHHGYSERHHVLHRRQHWHHQHPLLQLSCWAQDRGAGVNCGGGGTVHQPGVVVPDKLQDVRVVQHVPPVWEADLTWSRCSERCQQTRGVECTRGIRVDDSECSSVGPKPATSQSCTGGDCTYAWYTEDWSSCSSSCTWNRTVLCRDMTVTQGLVFVGDQYCPSRIAGPKPDTLQSCTGGQCRWAWHVGNWSKCSSSCSWNRTVLCQDMQGLVFVADQYCSSRGAKPEEDESCTGGNCRTSWSRGNWTSCLSSCNQTRAVSCAFSNGTAVDDALCSPSGPKPSSFKSCSGGACNALSSSSPQPNSAPQHNTGVLLFLATFVPIITA